MMGVTQALESSFLLDPEQTENEKRRRERHFHVVEVPRLRILGLVILTVLVVFHEVFSTGETNWRLPITIGASLLVYGLASWAVLYLWFERARPFNLGTLFLALDIPAFVWVIYQTGADNSWLFFLLYIRVADQTNTNFRRALGFSHVAVASYALLILYLAFVEHRPISWPAEAFKLLILYGANLYVSLTARTAERLRARMVAAIRLARDLVTRLQVQSQELEDARQPGRGVEPHQERVPRQHEPRDPDADERHHGRDIAAARHRPDPRSSANRCTWCAPRPSRCCA